MRHGLIFALMGLICSIYVWNIRNRKKANHKARKVQTFGKAYLDGKFDLVQTKNGEPFSTDDLIGKWALIYFGFTRCPDVCPEQLEKLAYVIQSIEQGTPFLGPEFSKNCMRFIFQLKWSPYPGLRHNCD